MEEQKEPRFYNVEQLSNILGISRSKTYELVSSPDCPFVALKIGKRVCIPANSFYKWYESLVQDINTEKKYNRIIFKTPVLSMIFMMEK